MRIRMTHPAHHQEGSGTDAAVFFRREGVVLDEARRPSATTGTRAELEAHVSAGRAFRLDVRPEPERAIAPAPEVRSPPVAKPKRRRPAKRKGRVRL